MCDTHACCGRRQLFAESKTAGATQCTPYKQTLSLPTSVPLPHTTLPPPTHTTLSRALTHSLPKHTPLRTCGCRAAVNRCATRRSNMDASPLSPPPGPISSRPAARRDINSGRPADAAVMLRNTACVGQFANRGSMSNTQDSLRLAYNVQIHMLDVSR